MPQVVAFQDLGTGQTIDFDEDTDEFRKQIQPKSDKVNCSLSVSVDLTGNSRYTPRKQSRGKSK